MTRTKIELGALSPPLHEQLDVPMELLEHEQKDVDALIRLRVRGIIPRSAARNYELRVVRSVSRVVEEYVTTSPSVESTHMAYHEPPEEQPPMPYWAEAVHIRRGRVHLWLDQAGWPKAVTACGIVGIPRMEDLEDSNSCLKCLRVYDRLASRGY